MKKVDHDYTYIYNPRMPNTKSAIRRVRRVKKQTLINRIRKSKYKNAIKKMELLLKSKEKEKVMQLGMLVDQMGQSMEEEEEIEPGSES